MFRDTALEQLYNTYIDALDRQWNALDYSGEVEDSYEWNWGMAERFVVYDSLNAQYHFLEENQRLYKEYVGLGEYYTARAAISEVVYRDSYESGENAYKVYNSTEYDYDLVIYIECFKGDELVYTGPEEIIHVGKGETVLLQYSPAPDHVDCDYVSPIAIWENVYLNGKLIEGKE